MKILKKAEQKNVTVNKYYYTLKDANELLLNNKVFYFDDNYNECKNELDTVTFEDTVLRIFTDNIDRLEVVLDDYGMYTTVAYMKNGTRIYVEL